MSIRPHPSKGDGWWYIDIGHGKQRQRYPFQGNQIEALRYEREIRKLVKPGPPITNPRLGDILDDYSRWYETNHLEQGAIRQQYSLKPLRKFFGLYCLNNINNTLIEQYKTERHTAGKSRSTINKELSALSGVYKWAVDNELIDTMPKIKPFSGRLTKPPLPNVPDKAMIDNLLAEVPANRRGLFALMFYAGLRASEAKQIKAEHVVVAKKMLLVTGKGGKTRPVPVPVDELWQEILDRAEKTNHSGYLWTNDKGLPWTDIRGSLKSAAKKTGWNGRMYQHLLRHAYGTELVTGGSATLRDVQLLMGHSTSQVTEIYTHLSTDRLSAVAKSLTIGDKKEEPQT